jgi:Uma2 family endonuclease
MSVGSAPRPATYRFDLAEFYRLVDLGFFNQSPVELIDGEIVPMAAQSNLHALACELTRTALASAFGPGHWVRVQMPLDFTPRSSPDPDVAVIVGDPRTHNTRDNPRSALLVVEVADTSLSYDRHTKANLYAAGGVSDYWIINLVDGRVEVRRSPVADPAEEFGHCYTTLTILRPGDSAIPLALPGKAITVAELLP